MKKRLYEILYSFPCIWLCIFPIIMVFYFCLNLPFDFILAYTFEGVFSIICWIVSLPYVLNIDKINIINTFEEF